MKVYLAGPMRGLPGLNHDVFDRAAAMLRALGHEVFSPAEYDYPPGADPRVTAAREVEATGFSLRHALGWCLAWITAEAEAIVLLPGWERSKGAIAEWSTAIALGLPAWEFGEFLLLGPGEVGADA